MPFLAGQKVYAEDLNLAPLEAVRTVDVSTTSTTYVFGSTTCSQTFTAPPSGQVKIQVYSDQDNTSTGQTTWLTFQVREGTSQSGTLVSSPLDLAAHRTHGLERFAAAGRPMLVSGLTAGDTYTAWTVIRVSASTGNYYTTAILVEPTL